MLRYSIFKQMDSFRLWERPPNSDHLIAVMTCLFVHRRRPNYLSLDRDGLRLGVTVALELGPKPAKREQRHMGKLAVVATIKTVAGQAR
jgi:hypothetical protein